jgi:hypothetical protein
MRAAAILLPFLSPKTAVFSLGSGKRKRRSFFKPTAVESQEWSLTCKRFNCNFVVCAGINSNKKLFIKDLSKVLQYIKKNNKMV